MPQPPHHRPPPPPHPFDNPKMHWKRARQPHPPRLYWLNTDADTDAREAMLQLLARSPTASHVRIAATDATRDLAGNVTRASTLSHVRALRAIAHDLRVGGKASREQVAFVAEDTLSYAYVHHWTTTLPRVIANAPRGWGVLQLAYTCDPHVTKRLVDRRMTPAEHIANDDPSYVEHAIVRSPHAPYVPWCNFRTGGTCFYVVHPRGVRDILRHVRQYKHDPSYADRHPPPYARFRPDARAAELFALTNTFTFHLPMFTTREVPHGLRMQLQHDETLADKVLAKKHRRRMDAIVKQWHIKYVDWLAARQQRARQQNQFGRFVS